MQFASRVFIALQRALWLVVVAGSTLHLHAQDPTKQDPAKGSSRAPVQDEFNSMDDEQPKRSIRETMALRIENTRQYYLQALGLIEKRDTARAALSFESAISELSLLNSMNGVERYDEYTSMLQSLCDDYERYIRPALRRTSDDALFALRRKIATRSQQKSSRATFVPLTKSPSKKSKSKPMPATVVPLASNEYVTRCIDFLVSEKGHKYFARWIDRTSQWFPLLKSIARQERVPEELVHIAMVESGLDPRSAGHNGRGVGLWHCSKETAERYNLRITPWIDERRDPVASSHASLRYLRDLHLELQDWLLAIAAYNAGADAVKNALAKSGTGTTDFWAIRKELPRETREYVPMVIAAITIALRYEDYGFGDWEMAFEPPVNTDTVTIDRPLYLNVVARCSGISTDSLVKINPQLLSFTTPPDESFVLRIPLGTRKTFLENLDDTPEEEQLPWVLRTVEKNETLAMIAAESSTLVSDICALNGFDDASVRLRPGQVLRIPKEQRKKNRFASFGNDQGMPGNTFLGTSSASNAGTATVDSAVQTPRTYTPVEQYRRRYSRASALRHTVRKGETIAAIANRYGTTVYALLKANRMRSGSALRRGQRLRIPAQQQEPAISANAPSSETIEPRGPAPLAYTVAKGDSLAGICTRFSVSEQRLRAWNPDFTEVEPEAGRILTIYSQQSGRVKNSRVNLQGETASGSKTHTVRKGETLSVIARKYGIPLKKLQALNGGSDRIVIGRKVRLR
jgi:membrane-bound lytic murein transglycosylase D